jgi:hypothetical protein
MLRRHTIIVAETGRWGAWATTALIAFTVAALAVVTVLPDR